MSVAISGAAVAEVPDFASLIRATGTSSSRLRDGTTVDIVGTAPRSRRMICARFFQNFRPLPSEGAGNAGRAMRPQPRVQMKKAHERSHHGHTGTTRHSL